MIFIQLNRPEYGGNEFSSIKPSTWLVDETCNPKRKSNFQFFGAQIADIQRQPIRDNVSVLQVTSKSSPRLLKISGQYIELLRYGFICKQYVRGVYCLEILYFRCRPDAVWPTITSLLCEVASFYEAILSLDLVIGLYCHLPDVTWMFSNLVQ